jgi:hypothetical protein
MPADTPQIAGLKEWMERSGVPHKVTSTWRPADTPSFHSQGLAVDFAGPVPSWDSDALQAVYRALRPLGPQCLELIYSGPGGGFWKNGVVTHAYAEVAHHNHVHIAMPQSWSYNPPEEKTTVIPTYVIAAFPYEAGYVLVLSTGQVYCFNCQYRGGLAISGTTVNAEIPQ